MSTRLYFVAIRERDFGGETVCAAHFEAATVAEARALAVAEFMRPAVAPPSSRPAEIAFCRRINEIRERVLKNGFVVIARPSKAGQGNAINIPARAHT